MRNRIELLVGYTAFPLGITASIAGAIALMNSGTGPEATTAITIAGAFVLFALLERAVPLHSEWSRSHGDVPTDAGLGLTNAVVSFGAQPLIIAAGVGLGAWASEHYGSPVWPVRWPLALQLFPALIVAELVEYSCHRAMHEIPWLWRIHAPHHSATRLYWFNAVRFHPLDTLLIGPGKLLPLVVLGADGQLLALVAIFAAVHGSFQHANIPCHLGPLNWVFSMAELHRWHHSPLTTEANHNYGGNLILWDIVFGTRWLPEDREPPVRTGIENLPGFPRNYLGVLAAPFRWRALVREASRDGRETSRLRSL